MGLTGNEIEDSLLQVVRLILYVLKLSFCRNLPGFCSPSHIAEDICLKNLVLLQSQFCLPDFGRCGHCQYVSGYLRGCGRDDPGGAERHPLSIRQETVRKEGVPWLRWIS